MNKKYILLILLLCLVLVGCAPKMSEDEYIEFEKGMRMSMDNLIRVTTSYLSDSDDYENRVSLYDNATVYYESIERRMKDVEKRIPKDKLETFNSKYSKVNTEAVLLLKYITDINYNTDTKEKIEDILNRWAETIDYSLDINIEPIYLKSEFDVLDEETSKKDSEFIGDIYIGSDLKIEDQELIFEGDYMYFSGYVKNVGDRNYSYVKVKAIYYDKNNNIIDTDWTYAVSSEGIAPNERKSFEIMSRYTEKVTQGSLSILEYK